jgi:tetratricopeptide (TPR) repeat protein
MPRLQSLLEFLSNGEPRATSRALRTQAAALLCGLILSASSVRAAEPKWIRVSSSHFSILTDAGEKKGREVALRFEQMRSVFAQLMMKTRVSLSQPLDVIAVKTDDEYVRLAPLRQGRPISAPGFFLSGEDRTYIVLDLFAEDSWRAVSHPFAHLLLNFNYPPTQPWFDEGFAEYFSSLHLDDKQAQIGSDPELSLPWQEDVPNSSSGGQNSPKSLTELLSRSPWQPIPELFNTKHNLSFQEGTHHTLFYAQSWIVVHYLINKNKLSETGSYFELVHNHELPVEQAIQQAFGMSVAQFEQAVKDYFLTLASPAQDGTQKPPASSPGEQTYQLPAVTGSEDVGTSTQPVLDADARALLAELAVRLPERRPQALQELQGLVSQPKTENVIGRRALAWVHMEKNEFDQATEELSKAMDLDPDDPWVRYYLAQVKYHAAQSSGQRFHGLSNMMQDLRAVLDWNPDFAEAYSMLALARVEGGGITSAMESMRAAIQLSPRNEFYLLNMAQIYLAGKKWEAATALLGRLKGSQNSKIAQAAQKDLDDLPNLKKYGLLPQQPKEAAPTAQTASRTSQTGTRPKMETTTLPEEEEEPERPAEPKPDMRPIKFLKARLISVDCSMAPAAVLTVAAGSGTMRLRAENYKSLLLVGADEFSCTWTNRPVVANYKPGGKVDGDLVSLEVQ